MFLTGLNSSTKVKPESSIQLPSTKSNKLSENDRLKNEFSLVSNSINNLTQTPTCSTSMFICFTYENIFNTYKLLKLTNTAKSFLCFTLKIVHVFKLIKKLKQLINIITT